MVELLPNLYEAASEGRLWVEVAAQMCPRLKAHGTLIYSYLPPDDEGTRPAEASLVAQSGFDSTMLDSYLDYYIHKNVWAPSLAKLPDGAAATSSMLFPDRQLKATEYYADWLRVQDIHYAIGGVVYTEADAQYKLSFVRSEVEGAFAEDDLALVRGLIPHIKATMRVADKARRLQDLLSTTVTAIDDLPNAVLLLSVGGAIMYANKPARRLMQRPTFMRCCAGKLVLADELVQRRLSAALAGWRDCASPAREHRFPIGSAGITLSLVPDQLARERNGTPIAAILAVEPHTAAGQAPPNDRRSLDPWVVSCRLTKAETEVLTLLLDGKGLKEISRARGCSYHTTRSQVAALLRKTGHSTQRALIAEFT